MSRSARPETDSFRAAGLSFSAWAAIIAGIHLLLGLLLYEPTVFPGGDNADYMILGESLRGFDGYRDLHLPGRPVHTKYPPGYPLLLAILGWFGGLSVFKLASLTLTTGAVWLTAAWGRRLGGPVPALLAAGLLAVNPTLLEYSHYVLSEAFFTLLIVGSLLFLDREPREDPGGPSGRPGSRARYVFVIGLACATLAFLTRTAGMALLVAVPAAAILSRRYRRAAVAGLTAMLVMGGWALFQERMAPGQSGYLAQLVSRDPYNPAAGTIDLAGLLERAALNAWTYVSSVLPWSLTGSPWGSGATWLGVLIGLLALLGWASRVQRRIGAAEVFTLLYTGLIAVWPSVWTDRRFLLPLLPLLLVYLTAGVTTALVRFLPGGSRDVPGGSPNGDEGAVRPGRRALAVLAVLGLLLAIPAVRFVGDTAPERVRCLAAYRTGTACDLPAMASLYTAARWAGQNTQPTAIIANRKPSLFFWFSRRQGDLYRYSSEPQLVLQGLDELGADYVVVDQVSGTTFRYLVPTIQEYRERFQLVYEGGDPPTLIFRYAGPPVTASRMTVSPGSQVDSGRTP